MRPFGCLLLLALFGFSTSRAQDDGDKFTSGTKVGDVIPGPFDALNINGRKAKGRQHCLVTDFGLNPTLLVFAREPGEGKDGPLAALLGKLDESVAKHIDDHYLGSAVIFLSPDARSSANTDEQDLDKIMKEAGAREALVKRLDERAEKLKHVILAIYPEEGPKGYALNPKAEVTVLFYVKHKVLANFAFPEGKLTEEDADRIVKTVDDTFKKKKKK